MSMMSMMSMMRNRIDRQLKTVWGIAEDNAKLLELGGVATLELIAGRGKLRSPSG